MSSLCPALCQVLHIHHLTSSCCCPVGLRNRPRSPVVGGQVGAPILTQACLMATPVLLTSPLHIVVESDLPKSGQRGDQGIFSRPPPQPLPARTVAEAFHPGFLRRESMWGQRPAPGQHRGIWGFSESSESLRTHRSAPRVSGRDLRPLLWPTLSRLASLEKEQGTRQEQGRACRYSTALSAPRMLLTHGSQADGDSAWRRHSPREGRGGAPGGMEAKPLLVA